MIKKFKVGDRVHFVTYNGHIISESLGTITEITEYGNHYVIWDDRKTIHTYSESSLHKAESPDEIFKDMLNENT